MKPKAKIYDPGEFEWLVTINQKTATTNAYNEQEVTLAPVTQVWAKKQYQSGREFYAGNAGQQGSKVAQEVVMYTFRHVDGLNEQMFISDDEGTYNITSVAALNRKQYHQVIAKRDAE